MGGSWRIGRIAGIDVYVHFTFVLLLAWLIVGHYMAHGDLGDALAGMSVMFALFGIIVLHELGHALAARHYGIKTRDITLLPIGGVARIDRIPEEPRQELVVALAGPAVNVVLAAAIYLGLKLESHLFVVSEAARVGGNFLAQIFWVNVFLAGFNLLPAFPMDGGRVLRALLAMKMDYVRATHVAARVGQGMAVLFAIVGLFGNPMLLLIALFVWFGAGQEASLVQMRSAMAGIPVQRVMVADIHALSPDEPISRAADHVLAGFQQDFPVVEQDGRLVGVLTRRDIAAALAANHASKPVGEVMQREFVTAHPRDMLYTAFTRLQECQCRTLPVVDEQDRLVGVLTADNLAEVLMIQQASRSARRGVSEPGDAVAAARQRLAVSIERPDGPPRPAGV